MSCGRFLIFGGTAGATSEFPGTITSSELGMALLAESDFAMGCAVLIERFFRADEGRGVVGPVGRGELVFLARSCFGMMGFGGDAGTRNAAVVDFGDGRSSSSVSVRAITIVFISLDGSDDLFFR